MRCRRYDQANSSEAIVSLLRRIEATPDEPISLYQIGIPLIVEADDKFTEDDVLNALYWLQSEKVIKLIDGNRLRLVKPLP